MCVCYVCVYVRVVCVYLCIDEYMCVFCVLCLCCMYVYTCVCMFVSICMNGVCCVPGAPHLPLGRTLCESHFSPEKPHKVTDLLHFGDKHWHVAHVW